MDKTLNGVRYITSGPLDAFTQLHIARKLGPALPILEGMVDHRNDGKDKGLLSVLMLAQIPDSDTEYVLRKCLAVVMRQRDTERPAKIQAPDGTLMFDDITMQTMLQLAVDVIEENLGDFFRTALDGMAQVAAQKTS